MALLDNGQDLDQCALELGAEVGQLLTPLTRYRLRDPQRKFAIDNGRFAKWEHGQFVALLRRNKKHASKCLFVTVPDVVGSARRTLEVFELWRHRLPGWPLALACQDGSEDFDIPWQQLDAVFIGGSTDFKMSDHAKHIIQAAQALDKWTHVGRVNDPERWKIFEALGVDSVDGTGIARFTPMREAIANRHNGSVLD